MWVKGLQQNKMLLVDNLGVYIYDASIVKSFLKKTQKALSIKEKTNKLVYINIKTSLIKIYY